MVIGFLGVVVGVSCRVLAALGDAFLRLLGLFAAAVHAAIGCRLPFSLFACVAVVGAALCFYELRRYGKRLARGGGRSAEHPLLGRAPPERL